MKNLCDVKTLKQAIRDKYAWPGGYPLYLIMSDGCPMSIDSARKNWPKICRAIMCGDLTSGWAAVSVDINYEEPDLYCCHSGQRIGSAYSEGEA